MKNSIDYLNAVEYHIWEIFALPLDWAPVDRDVAAGALEDGWTPEQFASWHIKNEGYSNGMDYIYLMYRHPGGSAA